MAKKILAVLMATLVCCGIVAVNASADSTTYSCTTSTASDELVSLQETGNYTILKAGDVLKFSTQAKITITYYADADAIAAGSVKNETWSFQEPGNLAASANKFKSFEQSFTKTQFKSKEYTVIGIGEKGNNENGTFKTLDSAGVNLGVYAIDYALLKDSQPVEFKGWVVYDYSVKSSAISLKLYGLWAKKGEEPSSGTSEESSSESGSDVDPTQTTRQVPEMVSRFNSYINDVAGLVGTVVTLLGTLLGSVFDNIKLVLFTWLGFTEVL